MITMPIRTPSATSPAVTRKSELPPLTGWPDALTAAVGLATATTDRVGDALALGAAVVGAAVVGAAVRDAVALGPVLGTGVVADVGLALAAVAVGDDEVVLAPSDAHARESATPGADAQTDRAGVTHELPSAAARESETRMNG